MTHVSFREQLEETRDMLRALEAQTEPIERMIALVRSAVLEGHTLFTCGNGGSATDAIHLAEELVGRYRSNRPPLPAVCLNTDVGALTCIANDFGYAEVFARQLAALGKAGDVLVCFSTSGNSPNIVQALRTAHEHGILGVALLGNDGGAALALADYALVVPCRSSARIQEAHTLLLHAICEDIEQHVNESRKPGTTSQGHP
jgi:D-sedoheptulose 7-phosphate isomerase